jgi:hypothetical protein
VQVWVAIIAAAIISMIRINMQSGIVPPCFRIHSHAIVATLKEPSMGKQYHQISQQKTFVM